MKSILLSTLFSVMAYTTYGQAGRPMTPPRIHPVIIPRSYPYSPPPIIYQLHDGIARLTDGSLLRGRFMYNGGPGFTFYQDGHSAGLRIYSYQFEHLALAGADTSVVPRSDSTAFFKVGNHVLRRLTIGKVGLYDKVYAVNEDKGKIGDVLFTWDDKGKLKRLKNLEQANQWFYAICVQNHWANPDVFLSKSEIIKRLAQLDPIP